MGLLDRLLGRDDPSSPKAFGEMTVNVAGMARDKTAELVSFPLSGDQKAALLLTYSLINLHWVDRFARAVLKDKSGPYYAGVRTAALSHLLQISGAERLGVATGLWDSLEESERQMRETLDSLQPAPGEKLVPGSLQYACGQQVAATLGKPDDKTLIHAGAVVLLTGINALQIPGRLQRAAQRGGLA